MEFEFKNGDDITDTVSLVISILVRYPEVSTVKFDPMNKTIKFSFLVSGNIDDMEFNNIEKFLRQCIDVYNMLEGRKPHVVVISKQQLESFTVVDIHRDVETLAQGEIGLLVMSLNQSVKADIIFEQTSHANDEEIQVHEELIESMLRSIQYSHTDKPLLAIREDGRVLVFNK